MKKVFRFLSLAALLVVGGANLTAQAGVNTMVKQVLTLFQQGMNDGKAWAESLDRESSTYWESFAMKEDQCRENSDANAYPGSAYWDGFLAGMQHANR
ncbi:hypothetical protein [Hymenobacter sp. DG25B]|uniref:hypothetical protein n=1 Tax=Hymenobacter sp. DG25B TaxID=1385664 RepID=UPI0012E09124|nr:hypothetical protein [Hymenobacter sp. DG25B]